MSIEHEYDRLDESWNTLYFNILYDVSYWLVQGETSGYITLNVSSRITFTITSRASSLLLITPSAQLTDNKFPLVHFVFVPLRPGVYKLPCVRLNRYDTTTNTLSNDEVKVITNGLLASVHSYGK